MHRSLQTFGRRAAQRDEIEAALRPGVAGEAPGAALHVGRELAEAVVVGVDQVRSKAERREIVDRQERRHPPDHRCEAVERDAVEVLDVEPARTTRRQGVLERALEARRVAHAPRRTQVDTAADTVRFDLEARPAGEWEEPRHRAALRLDVVPVQPLERHATAASARRKSEDVDHRRWLETPQRLALARRLEPRLASAIGETVEGARDPRT